jgi:branched-chain amino acid transport system ATP-binding protein
MAPILKSNGVTKRFGGLVAVNNLHLDIEEQMIASLIGPNGAGKTTFFNCVTGFYQPEEGSIQFNGTELVGLSPDRITILGIARTYQNIRLFKNMTAIENILVGQHHRLSSGVLGAILRAPRMQREERKPWMRLYSCWNSWASKAKAISWRKTCLTATSGGWRLRGLWPLSRGCCSLMSQQRA